MEKCELAFNGIEHTSFMQQSSMVENEIFDTNLNSSSNELESSHEQDLRQWMGN